MRICPACSREYGDELDVCKDDGVALVHLDTNASMNATDLIGQVVDGRYRVERIVGRGGMGTVYACRHVVVGKAFAMKVLRTGIERNEEILQRFIREAQSANAVKSRHICEMSDFGQLPGGAFFVVMELLEGMSLTRALREQQLKRKDIKAVFIQIAETLQKAHDAQIIHRDLKPDNVVLVTDDGDPFFVKLVDFGIAKMMQSKASNLTETGVILGTPYYMSPEQARGDPIDHRSDIYALGVMAYRAFTGKLPFVADTAMGVLTRHLTEKPQLPSLIAEMDTGTERLILRCLEKQPIDRYQTMLDVAEALRSIPDELPARSGRETMDERSYSSTTTSPYAAGARTRQVTPTRVATPNAKAAAEAGSPAYGYPQGPASMGYPGGPQEVGPHTLTPVIPPPLPMPARDPVMSVATPMGATPSGFAANVPGFSSAPPDPSGAFPRMPLSSGHPISQPSGGQPVHASGPYSVPSGALFAHPSDPSGSGAHQASGLTGVQPGYHHDPLPPHLQGESHTNRGVVSTRLSSGPQGKKRTALWLGLALVALGTGGAGAMALRSRNGDGAASAGPAASQRAGGDPKSARPAEDPVPSESSDPAASASPDASESRTDPAGAASAPNGARAPRGAAPKTSANPASSAASVASSAASSAASSSAKSGSNGQASSAASSKEPPPDTKPPGHRDDIRSPFD